MSKSCIVIPAIKKNAVIPDQLVKKLAGVTLIERGINTARGVVGGEDIYVLTDSQEISLICERAGVQFRRNKDLHFRTLNIVAEMRDVLGELAPKYEHCIVLRASCPLITWVDVEDAWHKYLATDCDSLVTVKSVRPAEQMHRSAPSIMRLMTFVAQVKEMRLLVSLASFTRCSIS